MTSGGGPAIAPMPGPPTVGTPAGDRPSQSLPLSMSYEGSLHRVMGDNFRHHPSRVSGKDLAYAFPIRLRRHRGVRLGRGRSSGQRGQSLERAGVIIIHPEVAVSVHRRRHLAVSHECLREFGRRVGAGQARPERVASAGGVPSVAVVVDAGDPGAFQVAAQDQGRSRVPCQGVPDPWPRWRDRRVLQRGPTRGAAGVR